VYSGAGDVPLSTKDALIIKHICGDSLPERDHEVSFIKFDYRYCSLLVS
jgi:hypothetical protein